MIGSRTIGTALVLLAALIGAEFFGLWTVAGRLDTETLFWAGLLAAVGGSLIHQISNAGRHSTYYYRFAPGGALREGEAHLVGTRRVRLVVGQGTSLDLPFWAHRAVYIAAAFAVIVGTFDTRSIDLLRRFPAEIATAGGRVCADPDAPAPKKKQEKVGCALVRRAFALGYTEDLGDCEDEEETSTEICTLRQIDEPLLHYAWRRLSEFASELSVPKESAGLTEKFQRRLEYVAPLYEEKRDVVSASPRASHHVFTNLPNPGGWLGVTGAQLSRSSACVERYRRLPHRPPRDGEPRTLPSRVFEHIFAQLLFETRYHEPVGYCPEYTIHWDNSPEVCNELVQNPAAYLEERGALDQVMRVLDRHARENQLAELREAEGPAAPELTSVVSFQCYIEEPDRLVESYEYLEAQLRRTRFPVTELRVPAVGGETWIPAERYAYVASFMAPEFYYSQLYSQVPLAAVRAEARSERFLDKREGYLSRLDQLTGIDVFLGESFLLERPDLLDVYPYHVHLENYVGLFRSVHREQRTRL
ncbi:MAG: hypothetical protein AAFX94_04570 [Myxococcota bacterium]